MPRRRSSVPLTKTFHICYSKLKRSIKTVPRKHKNPPSIIISSSAYDLTSPDFASDTETNEDVPPDLISTVFARQRFFFTSPGRSNSIVESRCRCIIRDQEISEDTLIINGGIPIQTYSSNPFIDFRRSMQQKVEANDILDVRADHYRKFMHELLLCYLALNTTENTHIFIVEAFVDVLISLATSPPGYRCSTSSTMASIEE